MRARTRSNRRLLLVLALAVLPPVVLVFGPFRDRFFPRGVLELRALARVPAPPDTEDEVRAIAGPLRDGARVGWGDHVVGRIAQDFWNEEWAAVVENLGSIPPDRMTSGLAYLHGLAALLDQRPALALAGLTAARSSPDRELSLEASFALAQAFLMLNQGDDARSLLVEVSSGPSPRSREAAEQLSRLDSLR